MKSFGFIEELLASGALPWVEAPRRCLARTAPASCAEVEILMSAQGAALEFALTLAPVAKPLQDRRFLTGRSLGASVGV